MSSKCPKCGSDTFEDNGKCTTCGYKNTYKKKNVQSSNALARKTALEKKQENTDKKKDEPKVTKPIECAKQSQKEVTLTPTENNTYDEFPTKDSRDSISQFIPIEHKKSKEIKSDDIKRKPPAETANIESEKEQIGFFDTLKQRFKYNFSKERKVEKIIPIDIDLNIDGYYDDVVGKEPCISEGIDIFTVLRILGSILGFISLLIFLINWL